jgi:tRNA A37 methylthiotransferase MiaB
VAARLAEVSALAEEFTAQRAEERIGSLVEVLIEEVSAEGEAEGRAAHQAPEVDGIVTVLSGEVSGQSGGKPVVGEIVRARVTASAGVDLIAEAARENAP